MSKNVNIDVRKIRSFLRQTETFISKILQCSTGSPAVRKDKGTGCKVLATVAPIWCPWPWRIEQNRKWNISIQSTFLFVLYTYAAERFISLTQPNSLETLTSRHMISFSCCNGLHSLVDHQHRIVTSYGICKNTPLYLSNFHDPSICANLLRHEVQELP